MAPPCQGIRHKSHSCNFILLWSSITADHNSFAAVSGKYLHPADAKEQICTWAALQNGHESIHHDLILFQPFCGAFHGRKCSGYEKIWCWLAFLPGHCLHGRDYFRQLLMSSGPYTPCKAVWTWPLSHMRVDSIYLKHLSCIS